MTTVLNLDTLKHQTINPVIVLRQSDGGLDNVAVNAFQNEETLDLTDSTIALEGTTASGKFYHDEVGVSVTDQSKGQFSYVFPKQASGDPGAYQRAYFVITKNGQRTSTENFKLVVLFVSDLNADKAEDYFNQYNELVDELRDRYDQTTSDLQAKYDQTTKDLTKEFVDTTANLQNDYMSEKSKLETDYQNTAENLKNDYATKLAAVTKEFDDFSKEVNDFFTSANADIDAIDQRIKELQADFATIDFYNPIKWHSIGTQVDLNDYKTGGQYWIKSMDNINRPDNFNDWGNLLVYSPDAIRVVQILTADTSGQTWIRSFSDPNWSAWTTFVDPAKPVTFSPGFRFSNNLILTGIPEIKMNAGDSGDYSVIKSYPSGNSTGDNLRIGSGGNMIIGSGESADTYANQITNDTLPSNLSHVNKDGEHMSILSDEDISFITDFQNPASATEIKASQIYALLNDNRSRFATNGFAYRCPQGSNLYDYLRSDSVPIGFVIVRDDNTAYNWHIIKESSSWIYGLTVNFGDVEVLRAVLYEDGKQLNSVERLLSVSDFKPLRVTVGGMNGATSAAQLTVAGNEVTLSWAGRMATGAQQIFQIPQEYAPMDAGFYPLFQIGNNQPGAWIQIDTNGICTMLYNSDTVDLNLKARWTIDRLK